MTPTFELLQDSVQGGLDLGALLDCQGVRTIVADQVYRDQITWCLTAEIFGSYRLRDQAEAASTTANFLYALIDQVTFI